MGFLSGLLSGGAALNVLGGMATQYNTISAENRAREFEEAKLEKKYEKEESFLDKKLTAEARLAKEVAKIKANTAARAKIETAKINLKKELAKKEPKGVKYDFSKYFLGKENETLMNEPFYLPYSKDFTGAGSKNTYFAAIQNQFTPTVLDALFKNPLYGSVKNGGDWDYTNKVNSIADNIVKAGLNTMESYQTQNQAGKLVKNIILPTKNFMKYLEKNLVLKERFEGKFNATINQILKELNGAVGDNGSVSGPSQMTSGDIKITYTSDQNKYFKNKNKKEEETKIASLIHPTLLGKNVPERMAILDEMVKTDAPNLSGMKHGGEFIVKAVSELKTKLSGYTVPLGTLQNKNVINAFFENTAIGKQLSVNPTLAIKVISMALPESVEGTKSFTPNRGALVGNQLFSQTDGYKDLVLKQQQTYQKNNAEKLGFEDVAAMNFKQSSLKLMRNPAKELLKLLQQPDSDEKVTAFVGLSGTFTKTWADVVSQYGEFKRATKLLLNTNPKAKTLFDESALSELDKLQKETNEFFKKSRDSRLTKVQQTQALYNYYAGVLTFTIAASVQSGSSGAVDSRTISDRDIQLWKSLLNFGMALASREGQTAVLEAIIKDADNKIAIIDGFKNSDARIQSAAKIANESYFGSASVTSQIELEKKFGVDFTEPTFAGTKVQDVLKLKEAGLLKDGGGGNKTDNNKTVLPPSETNTVSQNQFELNKEARKNAPAVKSNQTLNEKMGKF